MRVAHNRALNCPKSIRKEKKPEKGGREKCVNSRTARGQLRINKHTSKENLKCKFSFIDLTN